MVISFEINLRLKIDIRRDATSLIVANVFNFYLFYSSLYMKSLLKKKW